MKDGFEATFTVGWPRAEVWAALQKDRTAERWWMPAFESRIEELSSTDGERMLARKLDQPCADTEILVTLEDVGTGTRVTVVQSGFGDWIESLRDVLAVGWTRIVADLASYLEHGVSSGRHLMHWADPGAEVRPGPSGLVVGSVAAVGWAAAWGLQPDDVLLAVGGAPIVARVDLETALLALPAGVAVHATYLRAGEIVTSPAGCPDLADH